VESAGRGCRRVYLEDVPQGDEPRRLGRRVVARTEQALGLERVQLAGEGVQDAGVAGDELGPVEPDAPARSCDGPPRHGTYRAVSR
jgi:hypothetical protein